MICKHCGNNQVRKATVGKEGSAEGVTHYLVCNSCERVIHETTIPRHIPKEQNERYLKRIQKGKNDST